jgi:hypothetical protein
MDKVIKEAPFHLILGISEQGEKAIIVPDDFVPRIHPDAGVAQPLVKTVKIDLRLLSPASERLLGRYERDGKINGL